MVNLLYNYTLDEKVERGNKMLEKLQKNRKVLAFVAVIAVILFTGIGIYSWVGAQIAAPEAGPIEQTPRQNPPNREERPETGTTYHVGQRASAESIVHEGTVEYSGEVVNTYPQTGTVLMQDGAWGGVHEFSYTEVVDIKTESRKFTYDDVEERPSDATIRAVLTTDGELIALRDLNGGGTERVAYDYKIIETSASSGRNTYHQVYDEACEDLPSYIYDFLEEYDRLDMCE